MSLCQCRQSVSFASSSSNDLRIESLLNPGEPFCSRRVASNQFFDYLVITSLMPTPVFSVPVLTPFWVSLAPTLVP